MKRKVNPARLDPTRTSLLRKRFEAEMSRRFRALAAEINKLVYVEDAFGLRPKNSNALSTESLVGNTRWKFLTTPQQVEAFREWLRGRINVLLLAQKVEQAERAWLRDYIEKAYLKGMERAFDDVRKPAMASKLDFYSGTRSEFLRSSFGRPASLERIELLAGRSFEDLRGITETMSTQISRELTDGMIQGLSPRDVAKNMASRVDVGRKRALVISRTETVRAHNEGQLDALEELGVTEIGVMVEWSTSEMGVTDKGYPSPCELCAPLAGMVLKPSEAHGLLPRHPNCMCSFIPANVGEPDEGQLRTRSRIEKAINESIKAERPKQPLGVSREATTWTGADAKISKVRPKPII